MKVKSVSGRLYKTCADDAGSAECFEGFCVNPHLIAVESKITFENGEEWQRVEGMRDNAGDAEMKLKRVVEKLTGMYLKDGEKPKLDKLCRNCGKWFSSEKFGAFASFCSSDCCNSFWDRNK